MASLRKEQQQSKEKEEVVGELRDQIEVLVEERDVCRKSEEELFGRVSNLFDANYRDVVGYATQGRTVYGGVRLRRGD